MLAAQIKANVSVGEEDPGDEGDASSVKIKEEDEENVAQDGPYLIVKEEEDEHEIQRDGMLLIKEEYDEGGVRQDNAHLVVKWEDDEGEERLKVKEEEEEQELQQQSSIQLHIIQEEAAVEQADSDDADVHEELSDSGKHQKTRALDDEEEQKRKRRRMEVQESSSSNEKMIQMRLRPGQTPVRVAKNQFTGPSKMDPTVDSGKCQNHHLAQTTVSSPDKCDHCRGPVSSSKWLGYKCIVCSVVLHKSCLRRITNHNFHQPSQEQQLSKCSEDETLSDQDSASHSEPDQIPDDHQNLSDGGYLLDSDSENEETEDSDSSIPSMPHQTKAKKSRLEPEIPDDATSYGSDTSVSIAHSSSNAADTSESSNSVKRLSKKKLRARPARNKQESAHVTTSKKNYCYICGNPQSKISRHLKTHTSHAEIVRVFKMPQNSNERKLLIEKMRNKGNFMHNTAVLQHGTGLLKVKRRPRANAVGGSFLHCAYCQGMYLQKVLRRHVRRCPCNPENKNLPAAPRKTNVVGLASTLKSTSCPQISSGVWKLLTAMKDDKVASVVRNDYSILQFAQSLYDKHGQDREKHEHMRMNLHEVGRLLLCLCTDFSVYNMEEAVKPSNFQRVVQAVKKVSGFDEEKGCYKTRSLALKLGCMLRKICDIVKCRAIVAEDEELVDSTNMFKKLCSSEWSRSAFNGPSDARHRQPATLTFTEDVRTLHQYLEETAKSAFCDLKKNTTSRNYTRLAKVTLARIIALNRRHSWEVSKTSLRSFYERDKDVAALRGDVATGLTKIEQRLCDYFSCVETTGKRGRKVAVLLTKSMVDALSLMTSKRSECGVCETNVFLFARPELATSFRGDLCLHNCADRCGAKHPEDLRSMRLRKHVATLSQVLSLKSNELGKVFNSLGHGIRVHRRFNRSPVPTTTQLAKISNLLLLMEKRHVSGLQGKSLDDIEIEDEIPLSDSEPDDSGPAEPVDAASESSTEQVHDSSNLGQDAGQHEAVKRQKKTWSKAEVAAVMKHFRDHITKGKLASNKECRHCKLEEVDDLEQRTVQNIRDFVRNRGKAAKRRLQIS